MQTKKFCFLVYKFAYLIWLKALFVHKKLQSEDSSDSMHDLISGTSATSWESVKILKEPQF